MACQPVAITSESSFADYHRNDNDNDKLGIATPYLRIYIRISIIVLDTGQKPTKLPDLPDQTEWTQHTPISGLANFGRNDDWAGLDSSSAFHCIIQGIKGTLLRCTMQTGRKIPVVNDQGTPL